MAYKMYKWINIFGYIITRCRVKQNWEKLDSSKVKKDITNTILPPTASQILNILQKCNETVKLLAEGASIAGELDIFKEHVKAGLIL